MQICYICLSTLSNQWINYMEKIVWTIGEAAAILGENVSLVRFWANTFPRLLKPQRNAKGNRLFYASDIETLKELHFLIRHRGMTLEGAGKTMLAERDAVQKKLKVVNSLRSIKEQLLEIKKAI